MYNIRKRIDKAEKQVFPPGPIPHTVNIPGLGKMSSDEFEWILENINGGKGKLPSQEEKWANERY